MMMLPHSVLSKFLLALTVATSIIIKECAGQLDFDIYGNSDRFNPEHSVSVDKDLCEYSAEIKINAPGANLPFPTSPDSCTLEDTSCEGQSCLVEQRNVYRFDADFRKATGFDHVGIDWSPCGHPPLENFGRPHLNFHIFRITPEQRDSLTCDMLNPFICKFPPDQIQTSLSGKKFFIVAKEAGSGLIANAPPTHTYAMDSAVPGEGLHAWDQAAAELTPDWVNPLLVTGLYGADINFWEPMFPYEFASGDSENFYEEYPEYVSQTITTLPFYWSMRYDPETEETTLIMKGKAGSCGGVKSPKSPKKARRKTIRKSARKN